MTSWKTSAEADPKIRLQESEESDKTSLFLKNEDCGQKQKLDLKSLAPKGFGLQDVVQLFPMVGSGGRNFSGKVLVLRARRLLHSVLYRKIPNNTPRDLYFSKAFFEGLIFGGAYLRREICVSKSIWASLIVRGKFTVFALFYFFLRYEFVGGGGAYIWRGLYREGLIFGILR